MGQVKVFGLKKNISPIQQELSALIHSCLIDAFKIPQNKKFQRFILLDKNEFYFPEDRTENYIIIEISIFEGRSDAAKKNLIHLLFTRVSDELNISTQDIEITIFETPKSNWGIRGMSGDELSLNYKVEV
jgi:phenylpyruvate tautomerase PptA (4-oxalocrotonate tautomerase family)